MRCNSTKPSARPSRLSARAARNTRTARPRRSRTQPQIRPSVQRILDALVEAPAYVGNGRLDVLAAN